MKIQKHTRDTQEIYCTLSVSSLTPAVVCDFQTKKKHHTKGEDPEWGRTITQFLNSTEDPRRVFATQLLKLYVKKR